MDVVSQVVIFWAVNNGYSDSVPVSEVANFQEKILTLLTTNKKLKDYLEDKKEVDDFVAKELEKMLGSVSGSKPITESTENVSKVREVQKVQKVQKAPKAKPKMRRR